MHKHIDQIGLNDMIHYRYSISINISSHKALVKYGLVIKITTSMQLYSNFIIDYSFLMF